MNWADLKLGICPKCGARLAMGFLDTQYSCSERECDFRIGKEKFEDICYRSSRRGSYYRKDEGEQNLSALNNLGHDLVTEDFSDSPYRNER